MRSPRSVPVLVLTSTFVIGLLAGCGSDPAGPDAQATAGTQDEQVTLSVVSLIPGSSRSLSVRAGGIGTATGQQADHEGTGENQYRDGTWGPHRHSFLAGGAGWWWVSAVRRD